MRRRVTTLAERESRTVRLAWWVSFLATLALVAILGLAHSAQAASVPIAGPLLSAVSLPTPHEEEEAEGSGEDEEAGETFEACEESEEDEEGEGCEEETAGEVPDACILRTAEAAVVVLLEKDRVQVTVRYTTFSPALVSIRYGLHGSRGSLRMGADSRRFGRRGVFRETEELTETEMAKAKAATEFDVRVHAVNTPGYCGRLFDRRLTTKRSTHGRSSWTD